MIIGGEQELLHEIGCIERLLRVTTDLVTLEILKDRLEELQAKLGSSGKRGYPSLVRR